MYSIKFPTIIYIVKLRRHLTTVDCLLWGKDIKRRLYSVKNLYGIDAYLMMKSIEDKMFVCVVDIYLRLQVFY